MAMLFKHGPRTGYSGELNGSRAPGDLVALVAGLAQVGEGDVRLKVGKLAQHGAGERHAHTQLVRRREVGMIHKVRHGSGKALAGAIHTSGSGTRVSRTVCVCWEVIKWWPSFDVR
jgi:hypothetical protein